MLKVKVEKLLKNYFSKHPLVLFQIVGWTAYIAIDIWVHIQIGYFHYWQSVLYGLAALVLTTSVAYLNSKYKSSQLLLRALYFILILYLAAIIWQKLYQIIHFQFELTLNDKLVFLLSQSVSEWLRIGYMPLFLFSVWSCFYLCGKWYFNHQTQQNELTKALLDKKQAQLQTLRYQLNPHFLFNTLNSIDVSVLKSDKQTAHEMLTHLSQFLRNSLLHTDTDKVTVKQEFDVLQNFIAIEKLRFGESIDINIELAEPTMETLVPPMLLQPLVENAIKYAWSQKERGYITITSELQGQYLVIIIENSKGSDAIKRKGTGLGLTNVKERLQILYGKDASIVKSEDKHSFKLKFSLPKEVYLERGWHKGNLDNESK